MYQRTILNHYAFQQFFGDESRCGKSAAEKLAFTCFKDVSPKDWNLIIEVEAVLNSCAQYALGVTQKDATITFQTQKEQYKKEAPKNRQLLTPGHNSPS